MKLTKIGITVLLALGIAVNFTLISDMSNSNITLSSIENALAADGEEIVITCSGTDSGQCFVLTWAWCTDGSFFHYDCFWTGAMSSYCSPILRTICQKLEY